MKIFDSIAKAIQFLSSAVTRIFGPAKDDYPETGVQPFTGDPNEENA